MILAKRIREIREAMLPLIENGEFLHNEIISQLNLNDPNFELTSEENDHVENMAEKEFAQLSLILSSSYGRANPKFDMIMNYLVAALGINEIYGHIQNTAQLATTTGTMQVVKLIIRRYVGWIGVAVAVYSFSNCMGYF